MAKMERKKWTLMFFLQSDIAAAPEIVSQLKSIKQAGFHPEANVIAQFDPNPDHAETHIFDINRINKVQARDDTRGKIGFITFKPNDPFVVNLMTDKLWRDDEKEGPIRRLVINSLKNKKVRETLQKKDYFVQRGVEVVEKEFKPFDPPLPPSVKTEPGTTTEPNSPGRKTATTKGELSPKESLDRFLTFCSENYPADHYVLFILGHGVVVGNDTFLFDEHAAEHSLGLRELREVLEKFKKSVEAESLLSNKPAGAFELISFHSCSMSSLEIACELKGQANYMLASQSPSFVGTWPYRQILIRIFNYLEKGEDVANKDGRSIKTLFTKIFRYCTFNSFDFLVAGYPSDLCLCDLNRVETEIEGPISDLSEALINGLSLKDEPAQMFVQECILLAHLEAQSYFNENYVDVFDFCFRLDRRLMNANRPALPSESQDTKDLDAISTACQRVMVALKKGVKGDDDRLIVRSDFVGSSYQYSHGMSVFFPWSMPRQRDFFPREYEQYQFITKPREADRKSWSDFLRDYFNRTRRFTRMDELLTAKAPGFLNEIKHLGLQDVLLEAFATGLLNTDGQLDGPEKPDPNAPLGPDCHCQSIKNYPPFTRTPKKKAIADGDVDDLLVNEALQEELDLPLDEEGASFVLDGIVDNE